MGDVPVGTVIEQGLVRFDSHFRAACTAVVANRPPRVGHVAVGPWFGINGNRTSLSGVRPPDLRTTGSAAGHDSPPFPPRIAAFSCCRAATSLPSPGAVPVPPQYGQRRYIAYRSLPVPPHQLHGLILSRTGSLTIRLSLHLCRHSVGTGFRLPSVPGSMDSRCRDNTTIRIRTRLVFRMSGADRGCGDR